MTIATTHLILGIVLTVSAGLVVGVALHVHWTFVLQERVEDLERKLRDGKLP